MINLKIETNTFSFYYLKKRVSIMYIYLDDSGNIDSHQGNLYVWAGFSIKSGYKNLRERLDSIIKDFEYDSRYSEAKGSRATYNQRKKVFECLTNWDQLRICYIVVDKKIVTENQSKFVKDAKSRNKEQSENYFLSKVITRLSEPYPDSNDKRIIVNIDGSPMRPKESSIRLHEYLTLRINFPKWNHHFSWNNFIVKYKNEKNNGLLQAADFIASFIQTYYTYIYYKDTKNMIESAKMVDLYNTLRPIIHHKIYGSPKTSLI